MHEGHKAEIRCCLGVIKCGSCGRLTRPKTQAAARQAQIQTPCSFCGENLPRLWDRCDAKTYHFSIEREGLIRLVWEHYGGHDHERPPGGTLSGEEQRAVDTQVLRHQNASAHQLRTGDSGPGSVPFAEISETLANPRKARYELAMSQARLGIQPSPVKGGLSILHTLGNLGSKFKTPFLVGSSFSGPTYFSLRTPFMEKIMGDAIDSWIQDSENGNSDSGNHGCITDGDQKFFRIGNLLASCVWTKVMWCWFPVLYTWIDKVDADHHRPHFKYLFDAIVKRAGTKFQPKYLLNVSSSFLCLRSDIVTDLF